MAPSQEQGQGLQRLPMGGVADAVARWFIDNTPLPEEWDGKELKQLVNGIKASFPACVIV